MRARIAILIAIVALALDLSGALLTTNQTLASPSASALLSATAHRHAGTGLGAIAVGLLIWFAISEKRLGRLCWAVAAGFVLQGALGMLNVPAVHATFAHALVAATAALALAASPAWLAQPELVRDYGWPSMRSLAVSVPLLTLVQAALGAAFRQQLLGLTPHVIGAMVVSLLILMLGAFVLNQFPTHPRLRPAARGMMVVMFVQVFFGIAAFTVRSVVDPGAAWALAIIGGHVVTGSLTLAATVAMGMLIRREVQPKAA